VKGETLFRENFNFLLDAIIKNPELFLVAGLETRLPARFSR